MPVKSSPRRFELGPKPRADLLVARGQLGRRGDAADVHVGARLVGGRHAIDGAGHFAVDQDDALVAGAHLGPVLLHHEGLAEHGLEQLDQRVEVGVAGADAEHGGAAVAVERLQDDVLVLGAEGLHVARGCRVTSVGGIRSRKSSTNTFSGALRTCAGSLTTRVLGWMRSSRCVVVM